MFVRLTRYTRRKAGWFIALLYLFCVLAPGAALAFGDAASCLTIEIQTTAAISSHHHHEMQGNADAAPATQDHSQHQHGGKTSPGPCCAMLCVSGIAADLPALATPSQPISVCVSENFERLPGEAPPLLYRPPIA